MDLNLIRLNKFISQSGLCSRRAADDLISNGKVKVNGILVDNLGSKVNPDVDVVTVSNKRITVVQEKHYYLLNKPKNTISTLSDPQGRKTVIDIVKTYTPENVFPVGRLDRNTTGLLLLTNDGDLTNKLLHPSSNIIKIYLAQLNQPFQPDDLKRLKNGIELDDGPFTPDEVEFLDNSRTIGISTHSGRNRIIRRCFEHLGYEVLRLDRTSFAGLTKSGLGRGKLRPLKDYEIRQLKALTNH